MDTKSKTVYIVSVECKARSILECKSFADSDGVYLYLHGIKRNCIGAKLCYTVDKIETTRLHTEGELSTVIKGV